MKQPGETEMKLSPNPAQKYNRVMDAWKGKKLPSGLIPLALLLVMGAVTVCLLFGIVRVGAKAVQDSYFSAYEQDRLASYQAQYTKYYEKAEQDYHVSNRVSINIGDMKETAALEVLTVSDIVYIIEESSANKNGITSWLEVPGRGIYVVDLRGAEFIVDNERAYILARVPSPEITHVEIDYANTQKLLFQNDILNDSYKVGEELAQKQFCAADVLIKKELASNQEFYFRAKETASSTISYLIKQWNPEVSNLAVEVAFY